jgi:hypothetical protein
MSSIEHALNANRTAIDAFLEAADAMEDQWTTPRAPGKWSASQVIEHVARTHEEGAKLVRGEPSAFPTIPGFLRPLMRRFFFRRILAKGEFMRARTFRHFDPDVGAASPAAGRDRLEQAVALFERACRERGDTVTSGVFGTIPTSDYVRFQQLHTQHHQKQLVIEGP